MLRITLSANGSLYCCSDGVRGRGAAVTYLSHNASLHSKEQIAPYNCGIEHLDINALKKLKLLLLGCFVLVARLQLHFSYKALLTAHNVEHLRRNV